VPNFVTADFAQTTSLEVAQAKVEVSRQCPKGISVEWWAYRIG
jgi:hypothetical protein